MSRDISGRDWKNPPQTEYMKSMISASLPDVFHFVNDFIEDHESDEICIRASEFYETYKEWCRFSETKPKTLSTFGNTMCTIKGIHKIRKNNGWNYIVNKPATSVELSRYI
jgi:phage/plasmid-associated DNA primase